MRPWPMVAALIILLLLPASAQAWRPYRYGHHRPPRAVYQGYYYGGSDDLALGILGGVIGGVILGRMLTPPPVIVRERAPVYAPSPRPRDPYDEGYADGYRRGLEQGRDERYRQGRDRGYQAGLEAGRRGVGDL